MNKLEHILRPTLKDVKPYNSGLSISDIKARYAVSDIAKLGSNESPYGPPPGVFDDIAKISDQFHLYPESSATKLRQKLGSYLDIPSKNLIFGNGSEEILSIICRSVIEPNDRIITLYPSFPLHEDYATIMGGLVEGIPVTQDLKINMDALTKAAQKPAKMLVFANPMNPVGAYLNPQQLHDVIHAKHPDTLLVLDEAYFEYAIESDYQSGLDMLNFDHGNWIILRTFSKAWGLAGLRLGYGICSSDALRSALDLTRTPFNVNMIAQNAALSALDDEAHMKQHVTIINQERERVARILNAMGFQIAQSNANFLFFNISGSSIELADKLLSKGTIVKPWKQKGFENFIRVSIGTKTENDKFLADLQNIVQN